MTLQVQGNLLFATGEVADDLGKFRQALEAPAVDTIVFVNSPGGDLWTGLRVGRLIAERGLNTVVAGSCNSACSIMFMGGKARTFSDAMRPAQTFIGIHGAHNKDTRAIDPQAQPQIYAFYKMRMGERFDSAVMNMALYAMDDPGAMLRVYDLGREPVRVPYHCRSEQTLRASCVDFKDHDALKLGIVTSGTLTTVSLPAQFRPSDAILGRELSHPLADPAAFFQEIAAIHCPTDACRRQVASHRDAVPHSAMATAVGDTGVAIVSNQDSSVRAFVRSIARCNHPQARPARLCEVRTVNGFDTRDFYAGATASHAQARAKLQVPAARYYGNEEYGGAMSRATGLRTQKYVDITPQSVDGIRTIGTQELARAINAPQAPVLIDVWLTSDDAVPGAVTLLGGGLAFDDAASEAVVEARFAGLLKLLSPDPSALVVFYCTDRECWHAVNAALRARKLGYTQVAWYRGGLASWRAANLPMANPIVRATVN